MYDTDQDEARKKKEANDGSYRLVQKYWLLSQMCAYLSYASPPGHHKVIQNLCILKPNVCDSTYYCAMKMSL